MKCLAEVIQRLESLSGALPASAKPELNYVLGMLAAMLYDEMEDAKEESGMYGGD
jgi:hypothetical protein